MNRISHTANVEHQTVPHRRGDEPIGDVADQTANDRSPQAWG